MSKNLLHKWNFTGSWNDDQIERWLERMAAQGLHLESAKAFGRYGFRPGPPARVTYRIDVAAGRQIDIDYLQLLSDAGWRMAAQRGNTYYWRCERADVPELFTDGPSRALKYQRLARAAMLILAATGLSMLSILMKWSRDTPLSTLDTFLSPLWLAIGAYSAYACVRLRARVRTLRDAAAR